MRLAGKHGLARFHDDAIREPAERLVRGRARAKRYRGAHAWHNVKKSRHAQGC